VSQHFRRIAAHMMPRWFDESLSMSGQSRLVPGQKHPKLFPMQKQFRLNLVPV
jgi:hypothetical protein